MNQHEHTFKHSGKLGDILYSLPTIRALGGGILHLAECPELGFEAPQIGSILPLLRAQPYIRGVKLWDGKLTDYDLDLFRQGRVDRTNLSSLFLHLIGLPDSEKDTPWLSVPEEPSIPKIRTVIARSLHCHGLPGFWPTVLKRHGEGAVFVGTLDEHEQFVRDFGYVPRFQTSDLLELAKVIQRADLFIGNQSCPYAIAEGLKKNTIQECDRWSPNCVFDRPNAFYVSNPRHLQGLESEAPLTGNAGEVALARLANISKGPYEGKLSPPSIAGASVIILTYNSRSTIEECLQSVLPTLSESDELIVIDNASTDGTREFLHDLVGRLPATIILNEQNLGFSAGCNLGILESRGQFVVLLNPDTVVTQGWLQGLMARFVDPQIGAVGPVSDVALSIQFVKFHLPDDYSGGSSPQELAQAIKVNHDGHSSESKLLVGFCIMVRRDILNHAGLLDESMFVGSEDLEFSWRIRELGYKLLVARDVFVAHRCGRSFASVEDSKKKQILTDSSNALIRRVREAYVPSPPPSSIELWNIDIVPDELMLATPQSDDADKKTIPPKKETKSMKKQRTGNGPTRQVLTGFHEQWFSADSISALEALAHKVKPLKGAVIEIGCWEGAGAITLANAIRPEIIYAVDSWTGNINESDEHESVRLLRERDIRATFLANVQAMTSGNVKLVDQDCHAFESTFKRPIKLCHIDACHDYVSVKRSIENLLPKVVSGGILCGDDFMSAHAKRIDLDGGVERAVTELLPGHFTRGNFWYWVKP